MAINFPDPSQQTTYVADSGVTYEFIDGVWKATTFAGLGDVRYVNADGDDMSGNLTIATDKILLNTDGSTEFAGVGTFGLYDTSSASGTGVQVNSGGVLRVQRTSDAGSAEVFQGYLGTNVTSSLLANGSAYFASNVGIGTSSPARPLSVSSTQIGARFTSSSTDSQVEFVDTSGTVVYGSASGEAIVQTGGSESLRIATDGSATFAGNVISGSNPWNGASVGSRLYPQGGVFVTSLASNPVWRGWTQGSSTVTSEILGNGSATFAGTVDANALTVNGAAVDTAAQVDAKIAAIPPTDLSAYDTSAEVTAKVAALETSLTDGAPGALDTLNELAASLGDDSNFAGTVTNSLAGKADLSGATFAGTVTVDGGVTNENAIYGPGYQVNNRSLAARNVFTGQLNGATTSTILANGSASFAGDVIVSTANSVNSTTVGGVYIGEYGQIVVNAATNTESDRLLLGKNKNVTKFEINADGSAEFAGQVNGLGFTAPLTLTGQYAFRGNLNGSVTSQINADGSATFASNVGIGTQSPSSALSIINNTSTTQGGIRIQNATGGNFAALYTDLNNFNYGTAGAHVFGNFDNTVERLRIDSSGLVNVTGGIQVTENVTPTTGSGVEIFKPTSTTGQLQAINRTESTWMDLILKGNTQQFHANGSERMRLDSSGNVLIGGLTQATADIALNANGSATFAGEVQVGNGGGASNTGLRLNENGYAYFSRSVSTSPFIRGYRTDTNAETLTLLADGTAKFAGSIIQQIGTVQNFRVNTSGSVFLGNPAGAGNLTAVNKFILLNGDDGSATFRGNVEAGSGSGATSSLNNGFVKVVQPTASSAAIAIRCENSASSRFFEVYGDGSATFADIVNSSAFHITDSKFTSETDELIRIIKNGERRFVVRQNGSAEFAGYIKSANGTGSAFLGASTTAGLALTNSGGSTSASIFYDGSATFAGPITGLYNFWSSTQNITFPDTASDASKGLKVGKTSNENNAFICADGSATFASAVTVGPGNPSNGSNDGTILYGSGGLGVSKSSGALITFNQTGSGSTGQINADGSATFAGVLQGNQRVVINGAGGKTGSSATLLNYAGDGSTVTAYFTADGNATFAGDVVRGTYAANSNYCALRDGQLEIGRNTNDGNLTLIKGTRYNGATTYDTFNFKADGSAEFVGSVESENNFFVNAIADDQTCFRTRRNGVNTAHIAGDGSAEFAGGSASIDAAGGFQITSSTTARTQMNGDGIYQMKTDGTVAGMILSDGSATFASHGSFGNEVYVNGSDVTTQRYLSFARPTSGQYRATLRRDAWYLGETVTNIGNVTPSGANIVLNMDGSATFSGSITAAGYDLSNLQELV